MEEDRLKDLKERDEFADRIKKKMKDSQRNVAHKSGTKQHHFIFNEEGIN